MITASIVIIILRILNIHSIVTTITMFHHIQSLGLHTVELAKNAQGKFGQSVNPFRTLLRENTFFHIRIVAFSMRNAVSRRCSDSKFAIKVFTPGKRHTIVLLEIASTKRSTSRCCCLLVGQ